jgi:putative ABC transport system ATP-binding protein
LNDDRALAVAVRDVHKSYGSGAARSVVLKGCSFSVRSGELAYLMGPSGSGKTTLLSIIGCALRPDAGTLRVTGRDVQRLSPAETAELRRSRIGFVFQRFHLIRGLTALENVCVPLAIAGVDRKTAARRGKELLDLVGLAEHINRHPRRLSVGQCQRIALARALAADPPLVLADEPTAALDAESGQQAMQLLRRLTAESGKTAVVVTHDARIHAFADRIFLMDGGQVREQGEELPGAMHDGRPQM